MTWWEPIDATDWEPYAPESRGHKRPKFWFKDAYDGVWLRKEPPRPDEKHPHTARRSEPAVEALAIELARRAGLEVADTRPATWGSTRGVVSKRFHESDEQHHPGAELLGMPDETGSSPDFKNRRDAARASATFETAIAKLESLQATYGVELIQPFARVLVFDAWLGNGDRHSGNWAVITGPRGARFAPMYDPTACLGVELTDDRIELADPSDERIRRYARNCPSGFGGGATDGRTGIAMRELVEKLAHWKPWGDALSEMKPVLVEVTQQAEDVLRAVPDDWLSAARKRFAARMLARGARSV